HSRAHTDPTRASPMKTASSALAADPAFTGFSVARGQPYTRKLLRGLAASDTPQRITELRKWVREHREWRHKNVRTRANCVPCHADAERGQYDD
ncbi:MAG TPA: hypothetical protein PLV36_19170, partial [Zoogloea sp.]|nr:hypothetical protein [Zoogloea sp.]